MKVVTGHLVSKCEETRNNDTEFHVDKMKSHRGFFTKLSINCDTR